MRSKRVSNVVSVASSLSPKGSAKALSRRGPIDFLMVYCFVISDRKNEFQFCTGNLPKKIGKKPLLCGWVVGGGWTVHSLGPLIFLNFKYVKN